MKSVFKVLLMAIVYLATFIIGAASGAIHPAFYAYIGAALPLLTAFIYLYTCTLFPHFGAATALNGFILVLFLIVGEADVAFIIGMVVVTVLTEIPKSDITKGIFHDFFNDLIDQYIKLNAQNYFKNANGIDYLDTVTLHISNIEGLSLYTNGDFGII